MSRLEPPDKIEAIVGAPRHPNLHVARAVSAEQRVYILHSAQCAAQETDLRNCAYSIALDSGIDTATWSGWEDRPVAVRIDHSIRLAPSAGHEWVELATEICRVLQQDPMQYRHEADLQAAIAETLAAHSIDADREVSLSDGISRIDLLAGQVGIEVKIGGAPVGVTTQLNRYAQCPEISVLVLVTTRARHGLGLHSLNGKPLLVCSLIGAGL